MARQMFEDDARVYRAAIRKKYRGRDAYVSYEGPYLTQGAATARVTHWQNRLGKDQTAGTWAEGWVETGAVDWQPK